MHLIFDTETTGIPKDFHAPVTDLENWPRLVQLAWIIYDESEKPVEKKNYLVKPVGFTIPKEASDVHKINTDDAKKNGIALENLIDEFSEALNRSDILAAHNIEYDLHIVGAELLRKKREIYRLETIKKVCTMKESTDYCAIKKYGKNKWPNLTELHTKLFGKGFDGAHDAYADVEACARCYFELRKLEVIE